MSTTETKWVYGSYFSTKGGKNFVRPYISYNLTYTDTSVIVSYTAGINVKSNYSTNAKFTSTFSATGQTTKSKTVDNKGWGGGNHIVFDGTSSNIVYSKSTTAQTKTLKMASKTNVDSSSVSLNISIPSLGLPTISDAMVERVESTPTSVTVSFKASSSNGSEITAMVNGSVVSSVNDIYTITFDNVSEKQHSYVITATDSIGTSTITVNVSALTQPFVNVEMLRSDTNPMDVTVNGTINSFYKDKISLVTITLGSVVGTIDGSTLDGGGVIDRSNALPFTRTFGNVSEGVVDGSVSVTGYGGTTNINILVPSAFRIIDIGGKGKTIAFGMTARDEDAENGITIPENGLLECAMDMECSGVLSAKQLESSGFSTSDVSKLINFLGGTYEIHKNGQDGYSTNEMILAGCVKVAWGYSEIKPRAANTSTYKDIQLGTTFKSAPYVLLSLAGAPQIATLNLSVNSTSVNSFNAHIYASNTTTRNFRWLAIGLAEDSETIKNLK